jgi:hypothetical protein
MEPDLVWQTLGVTKQSLDNKAAWLSEQRKLDDRVAFFFIEVGKLVSFSWYHYPFASLALFQSIIGVEKALRLLNSNPNVSFQILFADIVKEGIISDSIFSKIEMTSEMRKLGARRQMSHLEFLSKWVPKLRNDYFHGTYMMSPDYLVLCCQMRELADALTLQIRRRTSSNQSSQPNPAC